MPEMSRNWYFEPDGDSAEGRPDDNDDNQAPGLVYVPAAVLQRHGARVLDPSTAAVVHHTQNPASGANRAGTPRSTVYRARTLLIPADVLRDQAAVEAINAALAEVGMSISVPAAGGDGRPGHGNERVARLLARLPRAVALVPAAPPRGRPRRPVVIDAWLALQALRAAAVPDQKVALRKRPVLSQATARRIALEHLLVDSAINGSPSTEGNGVTGSPSTEGNGVTGPGSTSSYGFSSGDTRAPVALSLCPPLRRPLEDCGPRRPVVAVLDTGVRAHPWLDIRPDQPDETVPDGFVQIDRGMQKVIYQETDAVEKRGDQPRQLIRDEWDGPDTADPLIGELETTVGHSTFISGIVRQVAPDAQVLAIRIMHSDGVVNEYDLIEALGLLACRVADAEAGDMDKMVDVVSLSLGYFDESRADVTYSSGLWQAIEALLSLGVVVVAAAGNFSTRRHFYPAAFSTLPTPGPVPLISVGALNPNGTKALFSDGGRWVTAWAKGASVVSTYPYDIDGCVSPQVKMDGREALDPDDYAGGFAVWSGTSFAAPLLAAHIARQLLVGAEGVPGLDQPGDVAARDRMMAALGELKRQPG